MIRVAVTGAAGRMGGQLIRLIEADPELALGAAVERPGHPRVGADAGEAAGVGANGVVIGDSLAAALAAVDVVIDFTSAAASMEHAAATAAAGKAIVIGSTGFTAEQKARVRACGGDGRVFMAPNMSIGINVLLRVVGDVARLLGEAYDVEIVETHHRFKQDAPSGTALALGEAVAAALGRELGEAAVHGRQGLVGARETGKIGFHAVRGGDVVGDHTVLFAAQGERVEITHKASSRETFAQGALRAARWLPSQPAGCYGMADLLPLA